MPDEDVPPAAPVPPTPGPNNNTRNAMIAAIGVLLLLVLGLGALLLMRSPVTSNTALATPSPTASASPTATPTATPAPTAAPTPVPTAAPPACGPFDTALHPLGGPPPGGHAIGVDVTSCSPGTAPASGAPFSVAAGWYYHFAVTCNGTYGPDGMGETMRFTPHNTDTNTDLATLTETGGGQFTYDDNGTTTHDYAPAGHYAIRATLVHPGVNTCQWHVIVYQGP